MGVEEREERKAVAARTKESAYKEGRGAASGRPRAVQKAKVCPNT